ncbi:MULTISPECIES: hypothetical protein [Kitasatospora]|uniref:Uncharacterized protein n=1 Tax=Kitasatospora cystarginea TaxID=58350 RepID=A0ABN3E945_9ACTN
MAREGFHYVRGHYRRNPRPRVKKTSGWLVAALLVGGLWLWGHSGDSGAANTGSTTPGSTASASAPAAGR